MTQWLAQFSIRTRLLALVGLTMVVLGLFALEAVYDRYRQGLAFERGAQVMEEAALTGDLIHQLQSERGLTGWLLPGARAASALALPIEALDGDAPFLVMPPALAAGLHVLGLGAHHFEVALHLVKVRWHARTQIQHDLVRGALGPGFGQPDRGSRQGAGRSPRLAMRDEFRRPHRPQGRVQGLQKLALGHHHHTQLARPDLAQQAAAVGQLVRHVVVELHPVHALRTLPLRAVAGRAAFLTAGLRAPWPAA